MCLVNFGMLISAVFVKKIFRKRKRKTGANVCVNVHVDVPARQNT